MLGAIAGLVDAGVNLFRTGYNLYTNRRDYDYQRALQQEVFAREDTAVQRRKEDLIKAGFNPALAMGQAASAGSVVSRSNTNDINPGSFIDTFSAVQQVKQQQQDLKNAKEQENLLKLQQDKINQEIWSQKMSNDSQMVDMLSALGLPVNAKIVNNGDSNWFEITLDSDYGNKYVPYARKNAEIEYEMQEFQKKLMNVDADWAEGSKLSQIILGLIRALK